MSNIRKAFENGRAFIPFVTCGYPDLETTREIILSAVENGADMIELGIPFSDPTAEGSVVQGANIHALEGGVTTDKIFEFVGKLRSEVAVPLVFMTYANVVFSYGSEKFLSACSEKGIDGIIVLDLPFEEKEEFLPDCRKYGVDLISVIASATKERIAMIAGEAEGFVYIAKCTDSACTDSRIIKDSSEIAAIVKSVNDIPCAAEDSSSAADGTVFAEDFIHIIAKHGKASAAAIAEFSVKAKASIA